MSRNSVYRLSVMIFAMAVCLTMPACRTCKENACDANEVSAASDAARDTLCKLKETIIPEMTFYSPATIVDALDFIVKASRDYDLPGIPLDQRGVSYRLRLNSSSPEVDCAATDPFVTDTNRVAPRIAAMSVRAISAYDALQLVCEATEMCWHIEYGTIVVEPNEATDRRSVTRSYSVPPVLRDCFSSSPSQSSNNNTNKTSEVFFAQLDMPSPDFSEFTYLAAIEKLRVTGTPKNLKVLETVLDQFAFSMIEVEMQIHAFRTADIEHLRLSRGVSLESLMALRNNGHSKPVTSATALTKSGQEAAVKAVNEVIYPAELLTDVYSGSNGTVRCAAQALVPSLTTMRETGMILQVVPEVMKNGAMINLMLKPQWITLDRWASYPAGLAVGWGWIDTGHAFKQPVFGVTSFETQAVVKDGEILLIGSCSTPDGEWVQAGFLTTRLKPVQPRYVRAQPAKAKPQRMKRDQKMSRDQELMKKIKEIVIPEVTFRPPATLIDAIRFLKEASIKYDQSGFFRMDRGVNFVLKLPQAYWSVPTTSSTNDADPFAASATGTNGMPVIPAMSARSISLYDALRLVCDVTGMKFRINDGVVWIVPCCCSDESLFTRDYYTWAVSGVEPSLQGERENRQDFKNFFAELGVHWPVGSSISWLPRLGLLRVTNRYEELDMLDRVCKDSSLFPRMVEVDVQIHAFSFEDIEKLRLTGDMSVKTLMALRKNGKARPVASATVMTMSGQEAVLKAVQEVVYPTELLTEVNQTDCNIELQHAPRALVPGNFTTRETGMTLQVVPEISSTDQPQIHVRLKPQWVTLEGWKSFPAERTAGWRHTTLPFKQPVFGVTSFETDVTVEAGKTVLLGSSSTPDGKWVHVGFLTVK